MEGEQRRPAVDAERDPAVRRRTVLERVEHRPELIAHPLERVALQQERALEEVAAEVRKYAELGVEDLALSFNELPTDELVAGAERFAAEVAPLV